MIILFLLIASVIGAGCGLLGALGGAGDLLWRRQVLPAVLSIFTIVCLLVYQVKLFFLGLLPMALWGIESIGYGIPDVTDKGSAIGRFWYILLEQDHDETVVATRLTIGIIKTLLWIWVPIVSGSWLVYVAFFVLTMFNQILWPNIVSGLNSYNLFSEDLSWEETLLNGFDGFFVVLLVLLSLFI